MSLLAFLALNAGAAATAVVVAAVLAGRSHPRRRLFVALCAWLLVVHSIILAAGIVGWLTPGGVAACLGVVLAGLWRARRAKPQDDVEDGRGTLTTATRFAPVVAIVTGVVWAAPHVAGATRLWIWDDYTYHMVYPALWLREGALAAPALDRAFTMQAWYPLSASIVSTWFMLPFAGSRGDALAWVSLTAVLYAGIVAAGVAELFARLGARPGAWAVPVVLFLTSHRIGVMASSFSDADLAQAVALFAAFVFAVPRGAGERAAELRADLWCAALLSGLAIGMKVTAAPTALVVLAMLVWRAGAPGARWRAVGRTALVFAVAWLATGGYWYVRNVLHTGNPFYPAAFLVWPGTTFPHTTLREYAQHYGVGRAVTDALTVYLNWPRVHALLAVVGLAGLAAFVVIRYRAMTRPQRFFASGALGIIVITLGRLPSTPYSAGNGMTFAAGFIHWDSMRYVALLPILGWAALGVLVDGAGRARVLLAVCVTAGALLASEMTWGTVALVLAAAGVVAVLVSRLDAPVVPRRTAPVAVAAGTVVIAGVLGWSHGAKAAATAAALHREPLYGAAVAVLDRQPAGTRVAVFGDQWIYPVFGARHDLVPVRVDGNGRIATAPVGDAMTQGPLTVDRWTFGRNLAGSAIDLVVVVHLPHPGRTSEWPPQATALENVGGTRLLYRDRAVGIWKLGD